MAALAFSAIPTAYAAPPGDHPWHPKPEFGHMHKPLGTGLLTGVTLTDNQKALFERMTKPQPPHYPGGDARQKLEDLIDGPTKPDPKDIQALEAEINRQDAAQINTEITKALELRALLTQSQIEQAQHNREQARTLSKQLHELTRIDLPHHGPEHHPDGPPPGPGPDHDPEPEQPPENP